MVPALRSLRSSVQERWSLSARSVVLKVALQNQESFLIKVPAQPGGSKRGSEDQGELDNKDRSCEPGSVGRIL